MIMRELQRAGSAPTSFSKVSRPGKSESFVVGLVVCVLVLILGVCVLVIVLTFCVSVIVLEVGVSVVGLGVGVLVLPRQ